MCVSVNTVCHAGQKKKPYKLSSLHFQFAVKGRLLFCKILESSKGEVYSELPSSSQRNKSVVF